MVEEMSGNKLEASTETENTNKLSENKPHGIATIVKTFKRLEDVNGNIASQLLKECNKTLQNKEINEYSDIKDSTFNLIRHLWMEYLRSYKVQLSSQDVANMMVLFKMARIINCVNIKDSYTDLICYGALAYEEYIKNEAKLKNKGNLNNLVND